MAHEENFRYNEKKLWLHTEFYLALFQNGLCWENLVFNCQEGFFLINLQLMKNSVVWFIIHRNFVHPDYRMVSSLWRNSFYPVCRGFFMKFLFAQSQFEGKFLNLYPAYRNFGLIHYVGSYYLSSIKKFSFAYSGLENIVLFQMKGLLWLPSFVSYLAIIHCRSISCKQLYDTINNSAHLVVY